MTDERVLDFFQPFTVWRCILCGAVWDRVISENRQASQAVGAEMPKFTSEEHRQKWIASVRQTKALKKQQGQEDVSASSTALPMPVKSAAMVSRTTIDSLCATDIIAEIDTALMKFDEGKAVLERAKEILSR
jgi:hypothetical protein